MARTWVREHLRQETAAEARCKGTTEVALSTQRPTSLQHAPAYGWDDPAAVDEHTILLRLLALNRERAGGT